MNGDIWQQFTQIVRERPHHPAILRGSDELTYSELHARSARAATALLKSGFQRGDRCIIWGENDPAMASAILAVAARGGIVAVLNSDSPVTHVRHATRLTAATHVIADAARFKPAADLGIIHLNMEALAAGTATNAEPHTLPRIHTSEPASIFFTSGSTGLPKGVTQSHQNLLWGAMTVGACLGYRPDDRILCGIPWAFDYGWGQLLSTLLLGITQVVPVARSSIGLCDAMERHGPTVLAGVPSLLGDLIRGVAPVRNIERDTIRLITNTGSKIPTALFPELLDVFPKVSISLNYGLTETYRSSSLPVHLAQTNPDSVGWGIPGVTLSVLREDGTEAATGEEGEIVHRGGGVFLGYWGEPDKTALVRKPDPLWRHSGVAPPMSVFTGDMGWYDERGLLYIRGRRDRQIKSMGVRVSPDEVENLIYSSGLVKEVAVLARPHEIIGDMVVAVVAPVSREDTALRDLKAFARSNMSQYMLPREWHVVESLPRTPSAKVDYPALKARLTGSVQT